LYLRDYVGDAGNPTSGTVSQSPDIIVRQDAVADPQTAFGTGSGTENNPSLSEDVETGDDNFVYVRVLNRGGSTAAGATVDVYWSPPSTLVTPNLWNLIGTATLDTVPTGNVFEVSDTILWPSADIPGLGHYCLVAVAGNAQDPKPDPTTFSSFEQYRTYVRNNNNVAWRNFDVINPPPSGFSEMDFIVPGAFDTSHRFELEALGRLPERSRVFLEVPAWFADALRPHPCEVKHDAKREITRIPLHPSGVQRLGSVALHARSIAKCRLSVSIPEQKQDYYYDFAIRQLYKGEEVGRLTWRFAPKKKKDDGRQQQQRYRKAKKAKRR
jgi:serine protease